MSYRPSIDVTSLPERAAMTVYSTLLGGSMGSRLFDEIREQRGLAYSVYSLAHGYADVGVLQLSAGLDSTKCVEAYRRMREIVDELRADGPREEEVERARAFAAGRMVLSFENTNAVARHAAAQKVPVRPGPGSGRGDRCAGCGHAGRCALLRGGDLGGALARLRRPAHHC